MKWLNLLVVALILLWSVSALAGQGYADRPDVQAFIEEQAKTANFDPAELRAVFSKAEKQQSILDAISSPAEAKPWYQYRKIFLTESRTKGGVEFWRKHTDVLDRAAQEFGVSQEIIVAIIGVETFYGRRTGSYRVLNALATLGFDYPPRASFFRKELAQYLMLARDEQWDMLDPKGSYAGAMGMGQFIPSSYRAYAVDFSGDGKRDLWDSVDAIGSVANYFKRHGWQQGEGVAVPAVATSKSVERLKSDLKPAYEMKKLQSHGLKPSTQLDTKGPYSLIALDVEDGMEYWIGQKNFYVITRYNHSPLYAMAVYQLAQEIKQRYQQLLARES
jgi:membrane-bound lytic murein transglycosylase B